MGIPITSFGEFQDEIGVMRLHKVGRNQGDNQMGAFPFPPSPSEAGRLGTRIETVAADLIETKRKPRMGVGNLAPIAETWTVSLS